MFRRRPETIGTASPQTEARHSKVVVSSGATWLVLGQFIVENIRYCRVVKGEKKIYKINKIK